jgi:hypothetical protein
MWCMMAVALASPISDEVRALAPAEVVVQYDEILALTLSEDEEVATRQLQKVVPEWLRGMRAANISDAGISPCGLVLEYDAMRHYSALGRSVGPPSDMADPDDRAVYTEILEDQFYPPFDEVQRRAATSAARLAGAGDGVCFDAAQRFSDEFTPVPASKKRKRRRKQT